MDSPALACPAPIFSAPTGASLCRALASPPETSLPQGSAGLTLLGPSAFSIVPPATSNIPQVLPALYPGLMCLPALLDRIGGANILRAHMSNTPFKPIPNNEKVDLARFRVKEPVEWAVDDVVSWMLDVAKRHGIPFEEMNMHRFASLTGQELMVMTEDNYTERDPMWGSLIFKEFKKLLSVSEDTLIDDLMKKYGSEEDGSSSADHLLPSTSFEPPKMSQLQSQPQPQLTQFQTLTAINHSINQTLNQTITQSISQGLNNSLNQSLSQGINNSLLGQNIAHNLQSAVQQNLQTLNQSLASSLAAGLTTGLSPMSLGLMQNGLSPSSPLLSTQIQAKISPVPSQDMKYNPASVSTEYDPCEDVTLHGFDMKMKKNKDGKPRKRSQHTKGNKLWEFIRDALKDPATCPSVVQWEDPIEGVFRIVKSEELARLWGERKNNTKMTYEKLSRAMRTYYEKQILVPVPKTGLYPKKLVYKFGPGSHGWEMNIKQEQMQYYYNTKILLPVSGRRLVYKFGPSARDWSVPNPIFFPGMSTEDEAVDADLDMDPDGVYYPFSLQLKYPQLPV